METSNNCFVAALQKRLKEQGRGSKKKLAADVSISPNHLSDILAGRKNAGQKLKERIAERLEMSFEDMLALGRHITEGQAEEATSTQEGADSSKNAFEKPLSNGDYLKMATELMESNTFHGQALINTIISLHQALQTNNKEGKALQMIVSLQEEIRTMRQEITELKQDENIEPFSSSAAA